MYAVPGLLIAAGACAVLGGVRGGLLVAGLQEQVLGGGCDGLFLGIQHELRLARPRTGRTNLFHLIRRGRSISLNRIIFIPPLIRMLIIFIKIKHILPKIIRRGRIFQCVRCCLDICGGCCGCVCCWDCCCLGGDGGYCWGFVGCGCVCVGYCLVD